LIRKRRNNRQRKRIELSFKNKLKKPPFIFRF